MIDARAEKIVPRAPRSWRLDPLRAGLPLVAAAAPFVAFALPGFRTLNFLAGAWWGASRNSEDADLPAVRPTLSLVAKVAIDEALIATMVALGGIPSWAEVQRVRAELSAARQLFDERGWLRQPTSYHRAPPPLEHPSLHKETFRSLSYEHLSFESGYEPDPEEPGRSRWLGYRNNRTAHAWVLRHQGAPRPWLVCLHGYRMGVPRMDLAAFRAAVLHFKLGLNVALPVFPLHGARSPGFWSGGGFLSSDALDTVHALAQAIWDCRRLLSWIRSQGAPPTGVYGISLGGYTAALLSTVEAELAFVIAGIPPSDFLALARNHQNPVISWLANTRMGKTLDDVEQVFRVVSPLAAPPRVRPECLYLFGGLSDRMVSIEQVQALRRHWERARCAWYHGSHLSFQREPEVQALLREAFEAAGWVEAAAGPPD